MPEEQMSDDLARCALRLKGRSLRQNVDGLYYLLQEPEQALEREQTRQYSQLIQECHVALQQIDRALHARSMLGRRASLEPKVP